MTQTSTSQPLSTRKQRRIAWWHIVLIFILLVVIVHTVMYFFFVPRKTPIFAGVEGPLNIAHQGGEALAPSNTMVAFDMAVDVFNVDVIETDIHMTKDGHLVTIHDETVDRTTNGTGRVDSFTLSELKELDAGYDFKDLQGQYSYRGKGATIATLDELFAKHGSKVRFIVEIKDAYPKDRPSQIEGKLWELIKKYQLEQRIIVASFDQALIDNFNKLSGGVVPLGAGRNEVAYLVITHKFWIPGFYRPSTNAIQIPTENSGFDLKDRGLIDGAHRLGIQVTYWTINDRETMMELLELGADGIITDRPDILQEVIQEFKNR